MSVSEQACKDITMAGTSQTEDKSSPGSCQFGGGWLQIPTEQGKKDHIESFFHLWQYLSEQLYETNAKIWITVLNSLSWK